MNDVAKVEDSSKVEGATRKELGEDSIEQWMALTDKMQKEMRKFRQVYDVAEIVVEKLDRIGDEMKQMALALENIMRKGE